MLLTGWVEGDTRSCGGGRLGDSQQPWEQLPSMQEQLITSCDLRIVLGWSRWRQQIFSSLTKPSWSWSLIICVLPLPGRLQETFCWCDAGGARWVKQHGAFWSQHRLIGINEAVLNQFEAVVLRRSMQGLTFTSFNLILMSVGLQGLSCPWRVSLHTKPAVVGCFACKVSEFDKSWWYSLFKSSYPS